MTARFDPVFDSQATFRALLTAMARPGLAVPLPARDPACPWPEAQPALAVVQTLLDHDVRFAVVAPPDERERQRRFIAYVAEVTGSRPVPAEEADFLLALGRFPTPWLERLRRGTPEAPHEGATLIVVAPPPVAEPVTHVHLTGPGIPPGGRCAALPALNRADLAALLERNAEPPLGLDVIFVGAGGDVSCLPRSTRATWPAGDQDESAAVAAG